MSTAKRELVKRGRKKLEELLADPVDRDLLEKGERLTDDAERRGLQIDPFSDANLNDLGTRMDIQRGFTTPSLPPDLERRGESLTRLGETQARTPNIKEAMNRMDRLPNRRVVSKFAEDNNITGSLEEVLDKVEKDPALKRKWGKYVAGAAGVGLIGYGAAGSWGDGKPKEDKPPKPEEPPKPAEPEPKQPETKPKQTAAPASQSTKDDPVSQESPVIAALNDGLKRYEDQEKDLEAPDLTSKELRQRMREDLDRVRQDRKTSLQWAEIAQDLIGSLTKYAAAKEGLDRGLDMSGVEVDKADWDAKIAQSLQEYENSMDRLTEGFDKEDEARDIYITRKGALKGKAMDIRAQIAAVRAAKQKEAARLREKRLSRQQKREIEEAKLALDREELRLEDKAMQLRNQADRSSDPKSDQAMRQIAAGEAIAGTEGVERELNRPDIRRKLDPEILEAARRPNFIQRAFGGKGKADPELIGKLAQLSGEDREAFLWATKNPETPQAEQILQTLGLD